MEKQDKDSGKHLNIFFGNQLLADLDDYRFAVRIDTRTEAIRFLIKFALEQKPKKF